MLVCEPKRCVSNVDRMALEHLKSSGIIFTKGTQPKQAKVKSARRGKVGFKALTPTGWYAGACDQCGKATGNKHSSHPYGMALCEKCLKVHVVSVSNGLKPSDEIKW